MVQQDMHLGSCQKIIFVLSGITTLQSHNRFGYVAEITLCSNVNQSDIDLPNPGKKCHLV